MPEYANTMPRVCEQYAYTLPVAKYGTRNMKLETSDHGRFSLLLASFLPYSRVSLEAAYKEPVSRVEAGYRLSG